MRWPTCGRRARDRDQLQHRQPDGLRRARPKLISGGNFHGQPVSVALDHLATPVCSLATISERRIERCSTPICPACRRFLAHDPGLHSGFMIAHVTAAALVSENKVLAHPASVDTIPTSAGKEDHVSMGAHAARKAAQIVDHVATVLAIELLCAAQALDMLPAAAGRPRGRGRARVPSRTAHPAHLDRDRVLADDIAAAKRAGGRRDAAAEAAEKALKSAPSSLTAARPAKARIGGRQGARTLDLGVANAALSQLS